MRADESRFEKTNPIRAVGRLAPPILVADNLHERGLDEPEAGMGSTR
jgi:hypothetical protein